MYDPSEDNADSSQAEIVRRRSDVRPVSPSFLQALGLMKITTGETTATSVPLSKSRRTGTDKNAAGSHTSASKDKKRSESKSVAASSTAKKTSVVKRGHVSKPKDRAKKRSHATSFDDAPQSIPVVVIKKTRKPAATTKPTTKKKPQDVEMQQHKASPPATKVSSSVCKSTVKTAENLSESTCAVDEPRFWDNILESDFKSRNFTTLLENYNFTEKQIQALQKSFYCISRMSCHRPRKHQRFMKTYDCIECNFSISHECVRVDSSSYYTFGGVAPCIDFITPESTTMCSCNFTIFHSHILKSKAKREAKTVVSSSPPSTQHLEENDRSVQLDCPTCRMTIFVSNRNNDICSNLTNFASTDGPIRNRFFRYVYNNVDYSPNGVSMSEFHSCNNDCCMLYHCCDSDVLAGSFLPKQPHRPLDRCHPRELMKSA